MQINKITLSVSALILTTIFTGCGGGGGSSEDTTTNNTTTQETTTSDLSGNAIDGYIKNALVKIGTLTASTDENGYWEIPNVENASGAVVEVSGGVDVSTGEAFEGVLKAPVPTNPEEKIAITPLSTVVASVVESGTPVEEATTQIAQTLGVSEDALTADPIERLKSGSPAQKAEAAKVVKQALVVQKMAETITKSAASTDEHQDLVFDSVMDTIAEALTDTTSSKTFDEVLADTTTMTEQIATNLQKTDIVIPNLSEKLAASADAALEVVQAVQAIDETDLAEATDATAVLNSKAKAIEVVTSTIEKAVENIAQATDIASIESSKEEATKTTQAIVMLGGVEGIATKLDEQEEKLQTGKTLDTSSFAESFLSDEVIQKQADTFDTLKDSGMTIEMIKEVGEKTALKPKDDATTTPSIADIIAEVVEASDVEITVDVESMAETMQSAVDAADEAASTATVVAVVDKPVVETPTVEEPVVEPTVVEEPKVEEPKVEEPEVEEPKVAEPKVEKQ